MAAKSSAKKKVQYWGTGRRKKAVARVRVLAGGSGTITVNKRSLDDYFPLDTLKLIVNQPFGYTGQAGAIRHGIARALCNVDATYRPALKKAGFLTRDPRMKERKKYGLKKARKAPQFSKR